MFNRPIPPITKNLLIINALFFLAKYSLEASFGWNLTVNLAAFYPFSDNFRPWQILTHMFMHADLAHFGFNMFALWMFGSVVEQTLGTQRFIRLYLLAGLGAFALFNGVNFIRVQQLIAETNISEANLSLIESLKPFYEHRSFPNLSGYYSVPMLGASGAIYGLLVAFAVWYPNQKLMLLFPPIPIKAKYFIPILVLIEFYLGIQNYEGNPIAHFAHLGGGLIGFFLMRYWKKNQFRY